MKNSISFLELEQLVTEFANQKQYVYGKGTVINLLMKVNKKNAEYEENSFMGILKKAGAASYEITDEVYSEAVMDCVKGYSSVKDSAIDIFKRLTGYIERRTGVTFAPDYPPIPVSNTFERLMYISKYIQDPDNKISDLEDKLWVSKRTIENDFAKLKGTDGDPIQVCGKKYLIRDMERGRDCIRDMASTPHPVFLTCNLTQIIVMLKGLKEMSEQPALFGYSMKTAEEIWEQLSDYARERILYVMENLMPDDNAWFEKLALSDQKQKYCGESFWPEYQCSSYGSNVVLESLKSNRPCSIEYQTEEGSCFYRNVYVKKYYEDKIVILDDEKEVTLELSGVIRSAKSPEEIF